MGNIDLTKMEFSGRMGPIVAYVVNGRQRFRTYTEPRNPKTPKQTAQRFRFGFVSSKVSPLFNQIKLGFNNKKLAFGTVCGKVNREAVVGKYPNLSIDYSKIQIAEGKLQLPANIIADYQKETNVFILKWDNQLLPESGPGNSDDKVNIVCYDESESQIVRVHSSVKRKIGEVSFILQKNVQLDNIHFWIYLSSFEQGINSNSIYVTR